jgi:hypothetical protein
MASIKEIEERVEETVERVRELWEEGRVAVISVSSPSGHIEVEDGGEVPEDDERGVLPSIEFENRWLDDCTREREDLELRLPPPWFDYPIDKAAELLKRFLKDFLAPEEGVEFGFGDGLAILNSFAKLCSELYEEYTTRGIEVSLEDLGGDYPLIALKAVWHG